MLSGKWTFRSYRNAFAPVGSDPAAALTLIWGEGIMDFDPIGPDSFRGGLGMADGLALTLNGIVLRPGSGGEEYAVIGIGIEGTATAGWRYDYRCSRGHVWAEGVDQVPSLVGTVVRVNAHGPAAPAGETAAFIAVRQPRTPAPEGRVYPRNVLMAQV